MRFPVYSVFLVVPHQSLRDSVPQGKPLKTFLIAFPFRGRCPEGADEVSQSEQRVAEQGFKTSSVSLTADSFPVRGEAFTICLFKAFPFRGRLSDTPNL